MIFRVGGEHAYYITDTEVVKGNMSFIQWLILLKMYILYS
jgi:hypothetical protein